MEKRTDMVNFNSNCLNNGCCFRGRRKDVVLGRRNLGGLSRGKIFPEVNSYRLD